LLIKYTYYRPDSCIAGRLRIMEKKKKKYKRLSLKKRARIEKELKNSKLLICASPPPDNPF